MDTRHERERLVSQLFPEGMDCLWCPCIVHYSNDGTIDLKRMEAHLQHLSTDVHSFLVFGSTGDGWELSWEEKRTIADAFCQWHQQLHLCYLFGVLCENAKLTVQEIQKWVSWAVKKSGKADPIEAMKAVGLCGFTVCAPKGKHQTQVEIYTQLSSILSLNLPTVIYQLPQITENEIAPNVVRELAQCYPSFFMFKDTSGEDRVIMENDRDEGIFFVRGAEGAYSTWYGKQPHKYDGFLLSSANCFAKELRIVLQSLENGETEKAALYADRIDRTISRVFEHTADLEGGNVFANANKCLDHCLALGEAWKTHRLPMRHCGDLIPEKYIVFAQEALQKENLANAKGYLNTKGNRS